MNAPLARDPSGQPFELPPQAAFWRVRRQTGGRPGVVLGSDGVLLHLPIGADLGDLAASVSVAGSYRLEPVDENRKTIAGAPVAYVELASAASGEARPMGSGDATTLARMADALTRALEAAHKSEGLVRVMEAMQRTQAEAQKQNAEIMVALIGRLGGGTVGAAHVQATSPLKSFLSDQRDFDAAIDRRYRNALGDGSDEEQDEESETQAEKDQKKNIIMGGLETVTKAALGHFFPNGVGAASAPVSAEEVAEAARQAASEMPVTPPEVAMEMPAFLGEIFVSLSAEEQAEGRGLLAALMKSPEKANEVIRAIQAYTTLDGRVSFVRRLLRKFRKERAAAAAAQPDGGEGEEPFMGIKATGSKDVAA